MISKNIKLIIHQTLMQRKQPSITFPWRRPKSWQVAALVRTFVLPPGWWGMVSLTYIYQWANGWNSFAKIWANDMSAYAYVRRFRKIKLFFCFRVLRFVWVCFVLNGDLFEVAKTEGLTLNASTSTFNLDGDFELGLISTIFSARFRSWQMILQGWVVVWLGWYDALQTEFENHAFDNVGMHLATPSCTILQLRYKVSPIVVSSSKQT